MAISVYQKISDKILEALESGVRPWEQCYSVSNFKFPIRITGDNYKGINRFLLSYSMYENEFSSPLFMTYNQARKLGGYVRKGEKASLSVFYSSMEVEDEKMEDGTKEIHYAKTNLVFNADQINDLPADLLSNDEELVIKNNSPIEKAEIFIENIPAVIDESDSTPAYFPTIDQIKMPHINQFTSPEHYYATAFHELTHWTGHKSRLNRIKSGAGDKKSYAFEELVAEIGASFTLPEVGIKPMIDEEHAPYIKGYIDLLKSDPRAFMRACSQAEKATDLLKIYQEEKMKKAA